MKACLGPLGLIAILLVFSTGTTARVDGGPPSRIAIGGQELHLAGCTVRELLWADLYSLALYLPEKMPQRVMFDDRDWARAVRLQILWNGYMPETFPSVWREAFDKRAPYLVPQMEALYAALRPGDDVWVSYVPESGSHITVNGIEALHRGGVEPMASLLHIWSREQMLPTALDDVTQPTGC